MFSLTSLRGHNSCQLLLLFYVLCNLLSFAYASEPESLGILIPRQEEDPYQDPEWVEGDGDDGSYTEDPATDQWDDPTETDEGLYPTNTDSYEDPSTETYYDEPTDTESYEPTETSYGEDPTPTSDYQDPSTETSYWDGTTTESTYEDTATQSAWEGTTTESYGEETSTTDYQETTTYVEETTTAVPTSTEAQESVETTEAPPSSTEEQTTQEKQTPTTAQSFSVTSSTATPSLVLGSNECASDPNTVDGSCSADYFCNAATKQCIQLVGNGGQCYEDFQCSSAYCDTGKCGEKTQSESSSLSGGEIAGVTIGSVAGAVFLVAGLMLCQRRRSRQVSTRARKFEQIRTEDDDLEGGNADHVMQDTGKRTSKYNFLESLMTGTAVGRSLSRSWGSNGRSRRMENQAYLANSPRSVSEKSMPGGLTAPTYHTNNHRESKAEQPQTPIDPTTYEDQEYYGSMSFEPSTPVVTNDQYNNTQNNANRDPSKANLHSSWMSAMSATDPFASSTSDLQKQTSVERPPTTVIRESTYNNLHAPIFHVSAPHDDNTVAAGGGAHIPAIPTPSAGEYSQPQDKDLEGKRGSWLLKEIASRWQQGSNSGARASGVTATTDASSVINDNREGDKVPHIETTDTTLWDDGLMSASTGSVTRSASTASTNNPFRNSVSNPRDSTISALRIPPIREDAWSLEDHLALTKNDSPVSASDKDTSPTSTK